MKIPATLQAAAIRGARTFAQAFFAVIVQYWITSGTTAISSLVDAFRGQADAAAGVGLLAALAALGWNIARPITPETK